MRNFPALLVLLLAACVTPRVQQEVLAPAIVEAWPGVRADAHLGGMLESSLLLWDDGVSTARFIGLDPESLEDHAHLGVESRLATGQIGLVGAQVLRDRATNFVTAITNMEIVK